MTKPTYQIIQQSSISRLEEAVNKEMRDGWRPVGGITVHDPSNSGHGDVFQAMAKDEPEAL